MWTIEGNSTNCCKLWKFGWSKLLNLTIMYTLYWCCRSSYFFRSTRTLQLCHTFCCSLDWISRTNWPNFIRIYAPCVIWLDTALVISFSTLGSWLKLECSVLFCTGCICIQELTYIQLVVHFCRSYYIVFIIRF